MAILGLLVTLLGTIISVASLGMTDSVNTRMIMTLVGLVVSLVGILGLINPAFQKNANWKK